MLSRLLLATLAPSAVAGCSFIVGDGTRVVASDDAGEIGDGRTLDPDAPADPPAPEAAADTGEPPVDSSSPPPVDAHEESAPVCTSDCTVGERCSSGSACVTKVCASGVCARCSPLCDDGAACGDNQDCASQLCQNGVCGPPVCTYLPTKCNDGEACGASADCASQNCVSGHCAAPSCAPMCGKGSPCGSNGDCAAPHMCMMGTCR